MTREQLILWNHLKALVAITAVVPLYYQGLVAGSEFLTYAATKLYFCLDFEIGYSKNDAVGGKRMVFYNELNEVSRYMHDRSVVYDSVGATITGVGNSVVEHNFYFSRALNQLYDTMTFNGYRITHT